MQQLTTTDLNYVVRRLPKDVRETLVEYTVSVAGGFIRETIAGNEPKDIDLFAGSVDLLKSVAANLAAKRNARNHTTDNAITLLAPPRMPLQFITRWTFTEPERLVESFDFTVCQAAIWFDKGTRQFTSMCSDGFYPDLAARRLVYTSPVREEEAGGSMMRVVKFLARGWNIQTPSLGAVMARVASKVEWDRAKGAAQRHGGSPEKFAGAVIAGLLREVDPLLMVDGLEPINEHEPI